MPRQLRAVDRTIAQDVAALPAARRTLDSVPGLGPVWTAGRLSEVGDIFRFASAGGGGQVCGAGLEATRVGRIPGGGYSAGQDRQSVPALLPDRGREAVYDSTARNITTTTTPNSPESSKHAHKRALVLTARKLVRLVDARLADGYDVPGTRTLSRPEGGADSPSWGTAPAASAHPFGAERALTIFAHVRAQNIRPPLQVGCSVLPRKRALASFQTPLTLHRRSVVERSQECERE